MDPNNVSGMSFVTGEESVPENLGDNSTLANVANQPAQTVQPAAAPQETATLSSVVNTPVEEVPNTAPPVQENATLSNVINGPVPETEITTPVEEAQTVVAPQEATTLSNIVSEPVQEVPNTASPVGETQNAAPPVQETQNVVPVQEVPVNANVANESISATQEVQNAMPGTTNIGSVTPNGVQPQPVASTPVTAEGDEKQKKITKILVIVVSLLLLTAIGIVLGFVLFNKFGNKGESSGGETTEIIDNTLITDNVINNYDVDADELTQVLKLLGVRDAIEGGNISALTYYVTDENYRDNAKDIILYYALLGSDLTTSLNADDYKDDKGACGDAENCAVISKSNAEKIISLYDFEGGLDDYFYKSETSPEVYGIRYGVSLDLPQFTGTNLGIGHNMVAKYVGDEDIDIEDTQVFNYNDDEGQLKNVNRVVKYTFKKGEDEEYHLNSVLISE